MTPSHLLTIYDILLKNWLQFIRFPNLFIIALTQYLIRFCVIGKEGDTFLVSESTFLVMVMMTLVIAIAGYWINDYYDYEIDLINKPQKVFINRLLSNNQTLWGYYILNLIGLALGGFLWYKTKWWGAILYPTFAIISLYYYAKTLKKIAFWGNLLIALLCALMPLMVWGVERQENLRELQWILYGYVVFAFISTLYREIVKDIEDMGGDRKYGSQSLPIIWGVPKTVRLILGIGGLFLLLVIGALYYEISNEQWGRGVYIFMTLCLPLIWTIIKLNQATQTEDFGIISTGIKGIMLCGLCYLIVYAIL